MPAAWLLVVSILGCSEVDDSGMLHDGWSGTPPPEPAEVGESCDEWVKCQAGAFCDFSPTSEWPECTELGTCVALPEACEGEPQPVCGCDGNLYESRCDAARAGVGTQGATDCEPPPGWFGCGFDFCEIGAQYCEHTIGHGGPETWVCRALNCPPGTEGCACITDPSPCGEPEYFPGQFCGPTPDGGSELTCLPA